MTQRLLGFRTMIGSSGPILALLTAITFSACREPTAPAELPVEFRRGVGPVAAASASIGTLGQDVVAVMVRTLPCNFQSGGSAALTGDRLDVTITLIDRGPIPCALVQGSSVDSVLVHGLPAGAYAANLHLRILSGGTAIDSTIARQSITTSF